MSLQHLRDLRVEHVLFKERYEDGIQEGSINGRVPLFGTSMHDSIKTIHPAHNLDRNSKMINGDQFAIAKAADMKFSQSNHMYPSYKIRMYGGHHLTNKITIKAIGSHRLSTFTKRVMNVKEMANMEVWCSYKTLIMILAKDVEIDGGVMYATRTSRIENQNTIDVSIVDIIDNTKEARAGIKEVPF